MLKKIIAFTLSLLCLNACTPASTHRAAVTAETSKDRISVGKVQREIRVGMSSAQVIEVLGSPNIVTSDEKRREVWTYDKVATETVYSGTSGGFSALILGFTGSVGGGIGPSYSKSSGASSTNQRTLTVIVKYDDDAKVRDFAYHTSTF